MIVLLVIIYLAFISLGLPDSILGTAFPAMRGEWGLPLSTGGVISMVIVGGTIISAFLSSRVIKRWGTGRIVLVSCLMTGGALLGFSLVPSWYWLVLLAVPLGLGAGTVDTSLNNFVALHYKAHHMNWLHSFWGVGATLGPVIMGGALGDGGSWRSGYRMISFLQLGLAAVLLLSLPLWKRAGHDEAAGRGDGASDDKRRNGNVFQVPGVPLALGTMLLYCTVEASLGLWGSSYLTQVREMSVDAAARWVALYYGGITAGRMLSGFVSFKLSNKQMIRMGVLLSLVGIIVLQLPLDTLGVGLAFAFIGMGLAPIFPAMIHETPVRFGKDLSQKLIGYQMGFAYIGSALLTPGIGLLMQITQVSLFPVYVTGTIVIMLFVSEGLHR